MIPRTAAPRWMGVLTALAMLASGTAAAQCDDVAALKKPAALGQFDDATIVCLEKALAADGSMTRRESLSKLLIANAFGKNDNEAWARHVRNHLETVNTSDCDLMYKYGHHLLKHDKPTEAVKWADSAEKNSYGWPEDDLADKLYELHRLKTRALWAIYESLAEEGGMKQRAALGQAQLASVEWIRYGHKNARDVSEALDFCIRTGWSKDRCGQQAAL